MARAVQQVFQQTTVADLAARHLGVTSGTTLIQLVMPAQALGRVNAAFKAVTGGLMVTGALVGGLLGELLGVRGAIWVGVAGLAMAPLLSFPGPLRRLREMPSAAEDPAGGQAG